MEYDENREVTRFIWNHHRQMLTEFELQVGQAILFRGKLEVPDLGHRMRQILESKAQYKDPAINAALADGHDTFRDRVRDRLLNLHGDGALITRCPRCGRVVRTPAAKQCLWCGEDWHGSSP